MRLLLDESLPRKLKTLLAPHEVRTVPELGWASKSNGELLRLAEQDFEIFLTADMSAMYFLLFHLWIQIPLARESPPEDAGIVGLLGSRWPP